MYISKIISLFKCELYFILTGLQETTLLDCFHAKYDNNIPENNCCFLHTFGKIKQNQNTLTRGHSLILHQANAKS